MEWNDWSAEQRAAILRHTGNTLVSASAGSGKTAVVVEHVVRLVTGTLPGVKLAPVPVRRILMLTFNNAVGEELREKIHTELLKSINDKNAEYLRDQLYDLPFADIGTLHGYCKRLISEHFDALGLDPAFTVMDEEESSRIFSAALTAVLDESARRGEEDVYELLEFLGGKNALREEITKLYNKACAEYGGLNKMQREWLAEYSLPLDSSTAVRAYLGRIRDISRSALKALGELCPLLEDNFLPRHAAMLARDAAQLKGLVDISTFEEASAVTLNFERFIAAKAAEKEGDIEGLIPRAKQVRDSYRGPLLNLLKNFTHGKDEEVRRMQSARNLTLTLVNLTRAAAEKYAEGKQKENKLDFDDLQQYACKLLDEDQLARTVADRYDYVCVDEYQDINAVQERLLQALTGEKNNLFMVGDAKQSIYAFRNADTTIFLGKYKKYSLGEDGTAIKLNRNFRSNGGILRFSNEVFTHIMTEDSCGLDYEKEGMFVVDGGGEGCVKVAAFEKKKAEQLSFDFPDGYSVKADALRPRFTMARREAIYIADKINKLVGHAYIATKSGERRLVEYGDITLLARTTTGGVPQILETLRNLGIPIDASGLMREEGNIYIDRLVDYLRVIDNFREDFPLSSALVQFGGFDFAECVEIRRFGGKKDKLWQAVKKCAEGSEPLCERVKAFVDRVKNYRAMSAYMSVSDLIRRIISDTDYDAVVGGAEGGGKFIAELNAFVGSLTGKQYDRSLPAFISVMNEGVKIGVSAESENCVRTCTVHSSKGLEFPVVFLIDSGTEIKKSEDANISFDRRLGIACKYADRDNRQRGDTLFFRFMREFKNAEQTGELIRLFYVALTRARNLLYITGTCKWEFGTARPPLSFLTMLSNVFADRPDLAEKYIDEDADFQAEEGTAEGANIPLFAAAEHSALSEYLDKPYRFEGSSATGIKYSVSAINKEQDTGQYSAGASEALFGEEKATVGTAYHRVLAQIDFSCTSPEQVSAAMENMVAAGKLTHAEERLVDPAVVAGCLQSDIVALARRSRHEREKRFTLYLPADEVLPDAKTDESVLVQGAIDLMIFGDGGGENVLVDFKYTTRPAAEVKKTYAKQLELYALAMQECAGIKPDRRVLYLLGRNETIEL